MDIDIDLAPSKKPGILSKIRSQIGELNILQVATFGTEKPRSAVLTACRGYRSEDYPNGIDVDMSMYECQYTSARRDTADVDSVKTVDALILVDENGNPIHQKTSPASVLDEKKEEGEDVTLDNL